MIVLMLLTMVFVCGDANVNFVALGDWGGVDVPPFTTPGQVATATGMQTVAAQVGSLAVIALGDNFYSKGITADEYSNRFQTTFESVYKGDNLQTPWYVILGNHDYKGNVTAQIEYSKYSQRWTMPSNFHFQSLSSEGVTVDIVLIDTLDMAEAPKVEEGQPGYFDPLPELDRSVAATQWSWIEERLSTSTADYLFVAGHYPVYSICEHGPTSTLITNLKPMLEKYDAHMLAGHDHCMEHIQETGSKVNYVVTGMGDTCCYKSSNIGAVPEGSLKWYVALDNSRGISGGFTSVSASAQAMTITFHDQNGKKLYATPEIAPRPAVLRKGTVIA